jgi:LacI family transcriptional regulator
VQLKRFKSVKISGGFMTVKIKDIAKKAGVSEATVSLSINNSPLVKEETKIKIKDIAIELGYVPNAVARNLAKSQSKTIGLIVPDIENIYYGKLVKHIDENIREAGYDTILAISNDKSSIERQSINKFISQKVEGVIIAPINQVNNDVKYLDLLEQHGIPLVCATSYYPGVSLPFVMVDLEEGTYRLVRYLLDIGLRNIAFLCGSKAVITTSMRIEGYIKAFTERGLIYDDNNFIECSKIDYDEACEVAEKLLRSGRDIDAIISINDIMALGVLNVLKANKIKVPGDISLAGYDNVIFSSIASVAITTVNQDIKSISKNAVNMLFNKIKGIDNVNEKMFLKPELMIRESTGAKTK